MKTVTIIILSYYWRRGFIFYPVGNRKTEPQRNPRKYSTRERNFWCDCSQTIITWRINPWKTIDKMTSLNADDAGQPKMMAIMMEWRMQMMVKDAWMMKRHENAIHDERWRWKWQYGMKEISRKRHDEAKICMESPVYWRMMGYKECVIEGKGIEKPQKWIEDANRRRPQNRIEQKPKAMGSSLRKHNIYTLKTKIMKVIWYGWLSVAVYRCFEIFFAPALAITGK